MLPVGTKNPREMTPFSADRFQPAASWEPRLDGAEDRRRARGEEGSVCQHIRLSAVYASEKIFSVGVTKLRPPLSNPVTAFSNENNQTKKPKRKEQTHVLGNQLQRGPG